MLSGEAESSKQYSCLCVMIAFKSLMRLLHCIAALMYVLVPMPCLFFGGGSTHFLMSRDGGGSVFLNFSPLNRSKKYSSVM